MAKPTKAAAAATAKKVEELKLAAAANAAGAEAAAAEKAGAEGEIVIVRAPEGGRRRAGLSFAAGETEVDLGSITRAQAEAILADPHLSVKPKPADDDAAS